MNIHEFQAKIILERYGIKVPPFAVASNRDEVKAAIQKLGLKKAVIKVQVHAGGRGKAGGVKFANSEEEIYSVCDQLIGMKIVNNQTGPEGVIAHQVMLSPPADIEKEYYVGAVMDRENAQGMLILSPEGGMEIEEIAAKTPEKILKLPITMAGKVRGYHLMRAAKFMGWSGQAAKEGMKTIAGLAQAFIDTDAALLEINPLILTPEGEIIALDAKLGVDDNALFRQKEIAEFYDPTQLNAHEVEANKHDLAYVALDGEIGCMVNGAGLAMSTMDIIQYYGGTPANFLDVGGSATKEKVAEGFKIILSDPKVKGILVNIFGGIMNCATIAEGVIAAAKELHIKVPLVVRMEGTNVENGRRILAESGLNIISAEGLANAAERVVKESKSAKIA